MTMALGQNATANSLLNGLKNPVKLDMKKHARCYKNRAYFMFIRTKGWALYMVNVLELTILFIVF